MNRCEFDWDDVDATLIEQPKFMQFCHSNDPYADNPAGMRELANKFKRNSYNGAESTAPIAFLVTG